MNQYRINKNRLIHKEFRFEGAYLRIWSRRIHFMHVILLLLVLYFLWHSTKVSLVNREIRKNGQVIIGVVEDVRKVGSKGKRKCSYYFMTGNIRYTGSVIDDNYKTGDSIKILYLLKEPNKNRTSSFFKN